MWKKIKVLVLLSTFLVFLIFSILFVGIKIDSFHIFNFKISQFYIKLDKKLIVSVDELELKSKKNKSKSSFEELEKLTKFLPDFLRFFQKIEIKNIKIDGNELKFLLDEDDLNIEDRYLRLISKIQISSKQISLDINSLYLKDYEVFLNGFAKLDYFTEEIKYFGEITYKDIVTQTNIDISKDKIKFFTKSEYFNNLHFLKDFLSLSNEANTWIYDKVEGKLKLDWFYGEYDLKNDRFLDKTFEGEAHIKDAKIKFHKTLDPIYSSKVKIYFKDEKLSFDLLEAKYLNKELSKAFVLVNDLKDEKEGKVLLNIETLSSLDEEVLKLLKAYKISLPLLQKSGKTKAKVELIFPFDSKKRINSKGEFTAVDAEFSLSDFDFKTKKSKVFLENDLLHIQNSNFLYKDLVDANLDINLDLKTLKSFGNVVINNILIKNENSDILNIKNQISNISMDFSKNVDIFIASLKTRISYDDYLDIKISDLSKIYEYSELLKANSIKNGELNLKLIDEDTITFKAFLSGFTLPIKKGEDFINSLELFGKIYKNEIFISSKDLTIKAEIKDEIYLFLDSYEIFYKFMNIDNKVSKKNIKIALKDCSLAVENKTFKIKEAKVKFIEDEVVFSAFIEDINLPLKKNENLLKDLKITGKYKDEELILKSLDEDLFLKIKDKDYDIKISNYDLFFNSNEENKDNMVEKLNIVGKNSKIFIDDKHILLSDFYEIYFSEDRKFFYLKHKETSLSFSQVLNENLELYLSKANDEFINYLTNKELMKEGSVDLFAKGSLDLLEGKLILKNSEVKNLSILNNILFFIETSPALINPILALPSLFGLNKLGTYKLKEGLIDFEYSKGKNFIKIKDLHTLGNGIDFEGKVYVDLATKEINSDIKAIFLKTYSSLFEYIPILNYILLGENKRIETNINISGNINEPKLSTNLLKESLSAPLNIFKRIFTNPMGIFEDFKEDE